LVTVFQVIQQTPRISQPLLLLGGQAHELLIRQAAA